MTTINRGFVMVKPVVEKAIKSLGTKGTTKQQIRKDVLQLTTALNKNPSMGTSMTIMEYTQSLSLKVRKNMQNNIEKVMKGNKETKYFKNFVEKVGANMDVAATKMQELYPKNYELKNEILQKKYPGISDFYDSLEL